MSNYEKGIKLQKEFQDAFPDGMSFRQMWFCVKFAKTVRKFARNNSAFNNLSNEIFEGVATFKEVPKQVVARDGSTMTVKGLQIRMKTKEGEEFTQVESDDKEGGD